MNSNFRALYCTMSCSTSIVHLYEDLTTRGVMYPYLSCGGTLTNCLEKQSVTATPAINLALSHSHPLHGNKSLTSMLVFYLRQLTSRVSCFVNRICVVVEIDLAVFVSSDETSNVTEVMRDRRVWSKFGHAWDNKACSGVYIEPKWCMCEQM